MKAKELLKLEGTKVISREVNLDPRAAADIAGEVIPHHNGRSDVHNPTGESSGDINARPVDAPMENINPYKPAIPDYKRGIIWRIIRTIKAKLHPTPTKEEMAQKAERIRRAAEYKLLSRESRDFRSRMSRAFEIAGLTFMTKKGVKRRIRYTWARANLDAHYIKVDLIHRPPGVTVAQLIDPELLRDLTMCCEHRVSVEYDEKRGVIYRIDRGSSRSGVPAHVLITDLWERFPESADGLTLSFGMTTNSRPIFFSLANMPHLLIGGTTGSGKSTGVNSFICTLIRRNAPGRLKILLIDLKRVEFDPYIGVPHLLHLEGITDKGVVKEKEKVAPALRWLLAEVERRYKLLEESGVNKIELYNQHHRKYALPRLVLLVDEWASIKLEKKLGEEAEGILTQIAEIGRAAGVHMIVATQTPTSQVLSTRIRNVIPAKLAFSCSNYHGSIAILGDGRAHNLSPRGRAIVDFTRSLEVQMPNIWPEIIDQTVTGVISGKFESIAVKHDVTPEEVMRYALENEGGRLGVHRLFGAYRDRGITREELSEWLEEWEGNSYMVNDQYYRVEPNSGSAPRRLVIIDPETGDSEDIGEEITEKE